MSFKLNEQLKAGYLAAIDSTETVEELDQVVDSFLDGYATEEDIAARVEEHRASFNPETPVNLDELTDAELVDLINNRPELKDSLAALFTDADGSEEEEVEEEEEEEAPEDKAKEEDEEDEEDEEEEDEPEDKDESEEEPTSEEGKKEDKESAKLEEKAKDSFVTALLTDGATTTLTENTFVIQSDSGSASFPAEVAFQTMRDQLVEYQLADEAVANTLQSVADQLDIELAEDTTLADTVAAIDARVGGAHKKAMFLAHNSDEGGNQSVSDAALLDLFGLR